MPASLAVGFRDDLSQLCRSAQGHKGSAYSKTRCVPPITDPDPAHLGSHDLLYGPAGRVNDVAHAGV